jgi:hypothetical protein
VLKLIIAIAGIFALAACDSGGVVEQSVRGGVRQSAVEACTSWLPQSEIVLAAGVNPRRLCGCAADRVLKDKSASELPDIAQTTGEVRAAAIACIGEITGNVSTDGLIKQGSAKPAS